MALTNFIRFFDKLGNDMNLSTVENTVVSLYDGTTILKESFEGKIFFPKVSIGLIESQQLFLLQEVTGPASNYQLRKIKGDVIVTGGNSQIDGVDADFSIIQAGNIVKISGTDYTVTSVSTNHFHVSPTPSTSFSTGDIYYYDYVSLNQLRSSPGTFSEKLSVSYQDSNQIEFFLYDVNYTEDIPIIEKHYSTEYDLVDGSSDSIDSLTGRIVLSDTHTTPTQINLGFCSGATATFDDIYDTFVDLNLEKTFKAAPIGYTLNGGYSYILLSGTDYELYTGTSFFIQGMTAGGNDVLFEAAITPLSVEYYSGDTLITIIDTNIVNVFNNYSLSNIRIGWKNTEKLATFELYGETEAEDERFKLLLENFGKKIDLENEYIFRDSDIHEELPDYDLLNKKRKELLLEGDNIYPYLGSYRALINIVNFFGYYDLRIKEYFLNVDSNSVNYNKYMHVLVPKDEAQRAQVRDAWEHLPSSIYKKTSLFGLFYDINRATTETDLYGIPNVEDAFDFSPEEVLIKLFGLKELLKKQFLPLNARIYDITGEGIYFERIRVDSWSDNLNHLVLNLGRTPQYSIYPNEYTYLTDIRRIDMFYIDKFVEQGLTGFSVYITEHPFIHDGGQDPVISTEYPYNLYSYAYYLQNPYVSDVDYSLPVVDEIWNSMPPGISNLNFNDIASRILPLPDDENALAGGPALLEAFFNLSWEESDFTWKDLGIAGPNGSPININHWSWESLGRGEFIEMKWTVEKIGPQAFFYDSGRKSIDDFAVPDTRPDAVTTNRYLHAVSLPYVGTYEIALYLYDITNGFSVNFQKYEVKAWNVDFVSMHKEETPERTWADFDIPIPVTVETFNEAPHKVNWSEITGPWYYPMHTKSSWEDAKTSWESLNYSSYNGNNLFEYSLDSIVLEVNRFTEEVIVSGDLTNNVNYGNILNVGDYLFFSREESNHIKSDIFLPAGGVSSIIYGYDGVSDIPAIASGSTGSYVINTVVDTTGYVVPGYQIYAGGVWYTMVSADAVSITVDSPIIHGFAGETLPIFPKGDTILPVPGLPSGETFGIFSRVLLSEVYGLENIDPGTDFYILGDGTQQHLMINDFDEPYLKQLIVKSQSSNLYLSWGIFAGTYGIEISNIYTLSNVNYPDYNGIATKFKLNDINKELFNVDGNFSIRLADYDVDYAETRIGPVALTYENLNEVSWSENDTITWFGAEYHGGTLCGFVIPFVSPSGTIRVDEHPSFGFSGDSAIDSTESGLIAATAELNSSENAGIQKFNYTTLPETTLYIYNSVGTILEFRNFTSSGSTSTILTGSPNQSVKIPGAISVTLNNGSIDTVNIDNTGWGYTTTPVITVSNPGATGTQAVLSVNMSGFPSQGRIGSVNIDDAGSGYTTPPVVTVEWPVDYKIYDNWIWTGFEWAEIDHVSGNQLFFVEPLEFDTPAGTKPMLPYQYHKQLFKKKDFFQQFYYFIHAEAIDPSNEMLSYLILDNGVESEWLNYPNRTYSYPLRNSLYFLTVPDYSIMDADYLYNKWIYEGSDYPPLEIAEEYSSNVLSYESRIPYSQTTQSSFSYIDTVISDTQQRIKQFTPVVFSYDKCRIPGKKNPVWSIKNDDTGLIEVMSTEKKLMWNFTRTGSFTVSLKLEDTNGNIATGQKNSFIVV
jgi:hypothetical protein